MVMQPIVHDHGCTNHDFIMENHDFYKIKITILILSPKLSFLELSFGAKVSLPQINLLLKQQQP